MRERIQKLSDRGEFILVAAICFGYVILSSVSLLLLRVERVEMSSSRVLRGIGMEMAILIAAGSILYLRGWRLRRLTQPLSLWGALAGIPLFVAYILLYWLTALAVVLAFPAAAHVVP